MCPRSDSITNGPGTRVNGEATLPTLGSPGLRWDVATLANQGHAGQDGGPQIDGCESEYEHCASVTRGDVHIVFVERMPLIVPEVNADVVRSKTFVERNAYLVAVHRFAQLLRRRLIEHDADLARRTLIGDAVNIRGLLELVPMRDNPLG